jgi:UTP--glucose-1-phosphate uridylyltransferase
MLVSLDDITLDETTSEILQSYGFDLDTFVGLRERLRRGLAGAEANRIEGRVTPPRAGDVETFPAMGSSARASVHEAGLDRVAAGEVGVVVLAGGMATRFGGVVKAAVEAVDGRTFLELKVADVRQLARRAGAPVTIYLMTSFATDEEVSRLAAELSSPEAPVRTFPQLVSLRLRPNGDVFRGRDGRPSPYAPGHGDLTFALRRSGALARLRESGVRQLYMSNVDNLGATLDPALVELHARSGNAITAEVVDKLPGDRGGTPARVDDALQIVESFRFPADVDQDAIPVFNTNSFMLDAAAIDRDFDLSWFAVRKEVDGEPAVQFERLVGQLTAFMPSGFVRVDRGGDDGRFQPAKDPEELARRQPELRSLLRARGVL